MSCPGNSSNNQPGVSRPSPGNKSKDPTCYSRGRLGHYASDTQCPNFSQPRMGAIQEAHDHNEVVDKPVDNADMGDPVVAPVSDKVAEATPDVDVAPEPSDHGIYDKPLVGSQYTLEGEDYPLEEYEEYSDDGDGERMMVIREHHLQYDADGAFPVVVEESDSEISEIDDSDAIEQRIQSIRVTVRKDAGRTARQTTTVVRKSSASMTCPKWPVSQIRPLVAKMMINRLEAVVMFDMGSTSDAVSPEFARVANMKLHSLDEPMGIQLGCKGSKSKIIFGTSGPVRYSSIVGTHYFDVVNID
jgi:hypothetical protein